MSYRVRRGPGVTQAIERLAETDPDGAHLIAAAFLALAETPVPTACTC